MMAAREIVRRCLVWAIVAAFFAAGVWYASFGFWIGLQALSAFPVVGAWILTSRPGNGVGRFLLAVGAAWALLGGAFIPEIAGMLPVGVEVIIGSVAVAGWPLLLFIGLIFPNGRIETRLGGWLAWGIVAVALACTFTTLIDSDPASGRANPFAWEGAAQIATVVNGAMIATTIVVLVGMIVDLVRRWRAGTSTERLQFRWFFFGMVGVVVVVMTAATLTFFASAEVLALINPISTVAINGIPVSIGIAITRHGLYEIGRVVSRTVSYALVTLFAVGVYALVVTSVSLLLPDQSTVPVAVATLVAAALFLPVLRWFQRVVDRRFDRERYDSQRVVDAFGEHLRTGTDPTAAVPELVRAVEQTLQPASVGFWTSGRMR